jgi:hypothetical protein
MLRLIVCAVVGVVLQGNTARNAQPTLLSDVGCGGKTIQSVPLISKRESFEVRTVSGFTIIVVRDGNGWVTQVFSPTDTGHHDNLLEPVGEWNGSLPSDVYPTLPPRIYPNTRVITVRMTKHLICLKVVGAKLENLESNRVGELPPARFKSGRLDVRWLEKGGGTDPDSP